jgi:hypothetical protein
VVSFAAFPGLNNTYTRPALARLFWMVSLICAVLSGPAGAQDKIALVIGNGAYAHVPALPNPPNDARDVASALERLGFLVTRVVDADRASILAALRAFELLTQNVSTAMIFFAGHGMEIDGTNYLIPTDGRLLRDTHAPDEAIALDRVLRAVEGAKKLRLVVLDACRDNPFVAKMTRTASTRSIGRGLAPIETGSTLVVYAAKEKTLAEDGQGRNSPFTQALLRHIETPGLELSFIFRAVRDDVLAMTNRRQEPFVYGSMSREPIFLKDGPVTFTPVPPPNPVADEIAWSFLDRRNLAELRRFIERYPQSGRRAEAEKLKQELERAVVPPRKAAVARVPGEKAAASSPSDKSAASPTPNTGRCFNFSGKRFCE